MSERLVRPRTLRKTENLSKGAMLTAMAAQGVAAILTQRRRFVQ